MEQQTMEYSLREKEQTKDLLSPSMPQEPATCSATSDSTRSSSRVASWSPRTGVAPGVSPSSPIARRISQASMGLVAPMQTGSMRACVLALTFSAVGAGILGLPWAVAALGWGLGLGMLVVNAILSFAALYMLIEVRDACAARSYTEAVETHFGQGLSQFLAVILATGSFGSCCASMMFATNFVEDLVETDAVAHLVGHDASVAITNSSITPLICTAVLVVILFALSWSRDLTRWRYASAACVGVLLYVAVALVVKAAGPHEVSPTGGSITRCRVEASDGFELGVYPGLAKMSQATSVFIFSFCCHFNLFSVMDNLGNPTKTRARTVAVWAVALQAVLYMLVGMAGYIVWQQALLRSTTSGNVLACWGPNDLVIAIGRGLMLITLLIASTMNVHPTRENILRFMFTVASQDQRKRWLLCAQADPPTNVPFSMSEIANGVYFIVTLVVTFLVAVIVVVVPSVLDVLGFVGGFCGVALMFVFPSALYLKICVYNVDITKRKSILAISPVLVLFCVFSFFGFVSVGVAVNSIVNGG